MELTKKTKFLLSIFALFLGCSIGILILIDLQINPLEFLPQLFSYPFYSLENFIEFALILTIILICSIAVASAYKSHLFNLATPGIMLLVGCVSFSFFELLPFNKNILIPLSALLAIGIGAGCGYVIGYMKDRFNFSEIGGSIFFDIIALIFARFIISIVTNSTNFPLPKFGDLSISFLNNFFNTSIFNYAFLFLFFVIFFVYYLFRQTNLGFELKRLFVKKHDPKKRQKLIIISMTISSAIAGIAGVCLYHGSVQFIEVGSFTMYGFDAFAIAMLALNSFALLPIYAIFSSFLIYGKEILFLNYQLSYSTSTVLISLVLYLSLGVYWILSYSIKKYVKRKKIRNQHSSFIEKTSV